MEVPPPVDFFLDMDFDEFIPVDNFYDQYLAALDARSGTDDLSTGTPPAAPSQAGAALEARVVADLYPQPPTQDAPHNGVYPADLAAPSIPGPSPPAKLSAATRQGGPEDVGPMSVDSSSAPLSALHFQAQQLSGAPAAWQEHRESSDGLAGKDAVSPLPQVSPLSHCAAGNCNGSGESAQSAHEELPGTSGGVTKSKAERQQVLNKAAQQRYRERKKAKVVELEQTVTYLQEKLAELTTVKAEKQALQERVDTLERQLVVNETQLSQVRHGTCSESTLEPESLEQERAELVANYHSCIASIRSFLEANGYNAQVTIDCVPSQHVEMLRQLNAGLYNTCSRVHKVMMDVDVFPMIEASIEQKRAWVEGSPQQWKVLLQQLQLPEDKVAQASKLRHDYLKKIEGLFSERQALNLAVVKSALPDEVGGPVLCTANLFQYETSFSRHRKACSQASVIKKLRTNLMEEQKALAELDYLVLLKLLDPLQSAKAALATYPKHCDVLSLLNVLGTTPSSAQ